MGTLGAAKYNTSINRGPVYLAWFSSASEFVAIFRHAHSVHFHLRISRLSFPFPMRLRGLETCELHQRKCASKLERFGSFKINVTSDLPCCGSRMDPEYHKADCVFIKPLLTRWRQNQGYNWLFSSWTSLVDSSKGSDLLLWVARLVALATHNLIHCPFHRFGARVHTCYSTASCFTRFGTLVAYWIGCLWLPNTCTNNRFYYLRMCMWNALIRAGLGY